MNKIPATRKITSYKDLMAERKLIENRIEYQKAQIQVDLIELKDFALNKIQPAVDAVQVAKKVMTKNSLIGAGTTLTMDVLLTRLFSKSHLAVRVLAPMLIRNLASHLIGKAIRPQK